MAQLKLNEAFAMATVKGKKVFKKEVAAKLWADSTPTTQQVNMTSLCNGTTKSIQIDWVITICEMLDCTADFLFGVNEVTEK